MNILKLIKERRTIRKYKNKNIPDRIINQILEGARWAPSSHNLQPWNFVVVRNRESKEKLVFTLKNPAVNILGPIKFLIKKNAEIIQQSTLVILVYNSCIFSKKVKDLGAMYFVNAHTSEIESIAAAIENMHLVAAFLGIGMAWLAMPLFVEKEITKLFNLQGELMAILTFGYPAEKGKHATRKLISEIVTYI